MRTKPVKLFTLCSHHLQVGEKPSVNFWEEVKEQGE